MTTVFNRWCQTRRYRATLRALTGLSEGELGKLMIASSDIERVAREVSQA